MATLATNNRARYDYHLEETILAGIALLSSEVKSVRNGNASIKGAFCDLHNGELWLKGSFINQYKNSQTEHDVHRDRKLLVTKSQLKKIVTMKQQGYTIVPTKMITKGSFIKLEIAIARGKRKHDKRQILREKDDSRRAKFTTTS